MVNFLGKFKNRVMEHFQEQQNLRRDGVWSHLRSPYVSYDLDFSDLQIRARVHVSKIFVWQNSCFWPKLSISKIEILEKSHIFVIWAYTQKAQRWLHRSPNSILSSDSDFLTNFANFMYLGCFVQVNLLSLDLTSKFLLNPIFLFETILDIFL